MWATRRGWDLGKERHPLLQDPDTSRHYRPQNSQSDKTGHPQSYFFLFVTKQKTHYTKSKTPSK